MYNFTIEQTDWRNIVGRILTVLTGVALCFVLTGCPMVGSKEIMGDKTAKASAVKWNGNWVSSDSIIQVRVKDKDKGVLEIYFIQRKKKQGPYKVYLRDVDGHIVARHNPLLQQNLEKQ